MLGRALAQGGSTRRAGSMPQRTRSSRSMNQPVTFHRKVKSAGYGPPTEAPRVLGKPRLNARSVASSKPDFGPPKPGQRASRPRSAGSGHSRAQVPAGPPLEHCPEMAISACEGYAVTDICFSPQASHLMVVGSDRTVSAYKLPLARSRPPGSSHGSRPLGLAGHQGDILSVCPSYTESHSTGGGGGPLLLTCGDDRTARLWALAGPHAGAELIRFDRLRGSSSCSRSQASWNSEDNPLLEQVQDSHFLCLDGAIALATGARLAVYRFQLHLQDLSDDIKRLQRLGSYRCCGLLALPREPSAGQGIVALAANNAVLSGTVLVASSSKRVYVWDVAAEKVLATVPDPIHAKAVTCLRMAQPHAGQSAASMDMFYSAGMDGCIKLWDLRTMQECRCFRSGHVHAAQRMRCRLSPCLRYMATPSEDGSVCVYDVRTGNVLGTKHCHKDAAVAVDLHPRTGAMASGGFDGQVQFFRSPTSGAGRPPGARCCIGHDAVSCLQLLS
ncbi:WDR27 [Symbiodinium natans]|uniref:WDR27 protein n=1 Tax=Symbiodinium natans TaxID=878477 RepID=A0A812TN34_9DINO|nr:WDR27 [Symbiodinium natans]